MTTSTLLLSLALALGGSAVLAPGSVVSAASAGGNMAQPGDKAGPQMGEDVPALKLRAYNEDVALKLVSAPEVSVHNFIGVAPEVPHSAVVLHFFSVNNERSVDDLEMLQKLYRRYRDDGLMVITVSIDKDDSEAVYRVIEDADVAFPVLKDRFGVVARRYGLRQLPTLYVINSEGRVASVREAYTGNVNSVLEEEVKAALK